MAYVHDGKVYVDLSGSDGNVFALLGITKTVLEASDMDSGEMALFESFVDDLQSRPYEQTLAFVAALLHGIVVFINVPLCYQEFVSSPHGTIDEDKDVQQASIH